MIDLVGKRFLFLGISLLVILPGVIAILAGGLRPGIDFTGGTRWEVRPLNASADNTETFRSALTGAGVKDPAVKKATVGTGSQAYDTIVMDLPGNVTGDQKANLEQVLISQGLVAGETVTETQSITSTGTLTDTGTPGVTATGTVTSTGSVTSTGGITSTGTTSGTTGTTAPATTDGNSPADFPSRRELRGYRPDDR